MCANAVDKIDCLHLRPFATEIVTYILIVIRQQDYGQSAARIFNHPEIITDFFNIQYFITDNKLYFQVWAIYSL